MLSETARLLGDTLPITAWAGDDPSVSASQIVYDDSRIGALESLAGLVDAAPWAGRDGSYTLLPTAAGTPDWSVTVADPASPDDTGTLVSATTQVSRDALYNAVFVDGETADQSPVRGTALQTSGPLAWGGPFGRVPYRQQNPLYQSNSSAQKGAVSTLARLVARRSVPLRVSCVTNPAVDPLDTVEIVTATRTMTGIVTSVSMPILAPRMSVIVAVPFGQVWDV